MPLTQNSITFFCKTFEAIWLKCLKSIWPTHVSPETVPRTYSHRKQSPKHQFYQPQQHLIKTVSLVEECDFIRRVELTDSQLDHNKNKQNISLCKLMLLAPRPKSPNLLLSFFFPTVLLDVVSVFLFVSFLLVPSYCCSLVPRYSQSFFIFKLI